MWGKQATFDNLEAKLFLPSNSEEGCAAYEKPDGASDSFAILVNGLEKCPLGNLIQNAQDVNATALMIVDPRNQNISNAELPHQVSGRLY